jgi:hypothetical protein
MYYNLDWSNLKNSQDFLNEKNLLAEIGITSKTWISVFIGVSHGLSGATVYNILRQVSYFMPKGYRLGNRIRARHSARKIIGDTRTD